MTSPYQVRPCDADRTLLQARVRAGNTPQKMVLRALIVLMAADGASNATIVEELGVCVDTARKWRARFCANGIEGLADARRSGRPPVYSAGEVAGVKALACELPAETGSRCRGGAARSWPASCSPPDRAPRRPPSAAGSPRTRSSPGSTGPGSSPATRSSRPRPAACSTCTPRHLDGALGADEYVICADEKTAIQARCRCHPTSPPRPGPGHAGGARVRRGGALAYLAAWDVHRGRVSAAASTTTGIVPFAALVDQVMSHEPYASAERVFWIVDNGSSHRGEAADRPAQRAHTRTRSSSTSRPRLLAQPDRDLLLHRPAQSRHAQRLHRPQEAWTGVWTMIALGYCAASRSIAACPRWEDPLSTIQKTRLAEA